MIDYLEHREKLEDEVYKYLEARDGQDQALRKVLHMSYRELQDMVREIKEIK